MGLGAPVDIPLRESIENGLFVMKGGVIYKNEGATRMREIP